MHLNIISTFIIFLFFTINQGFSQDCNCLISEVENNTVNSCDFTIGTTVNVSNSAEFINAVNNANNSGGNVTILIADGTYEVASTSWYPYITASNVVFRSQSGNRDAVILTGSGMNAVSGTEIGIYAVGDNITIADLTIRDVGNHGIAVTGDNLFVYNVKIQDTFEQMIKGNSSQGGINNGRVKCSLFEYTNGIGPQWYIGGLDIHTGTNWTVSDNVFYDISSPSQALAEHAIHFWDSSADNLVERNKIVNCDRGIGFGLGSSANSGGVIKNNMIYNDGTNIYDDVGIGLESSPDTKVFNNTIYIEYPNAIEYRFEETTNVEITNNLTNKLIRSRNGGTATLNTNYTEANTSWLLDAELGDLRLSTNIPELVDQGSNLDDVIIDIDQVDRPQGNGFDIGSSEFVLPTFVKNEEKESLKVIVYPNPSSEFFTFKSIDSELLSISIFDLMNQKVASFEGNRLISNIEIDASEWNAGIYICHIQGIDGKQMYLRLLVSK